MKTAVYATFFTLLLLACHSSNEKQEAPSEEPETMYQVRLDPEQLETADIQVAHLQKRLMGEKIRVNGLFDVPPQNRAEVSSLVDAFVKKITLLVGDKVEKGQELVWLHHPEIIDMQNEFIEKNQQLEYSKTEYERQVQLDENRINAKKNLIKAETDYKGMLAVVNALKEKLRMVGIDPTQVAKGRIYKEISLRSPINGYITKVNVSLGSMVKLGQPIFEIIDPEHLHIELKVFEKDIGQIDADEPFTFSISGDTTTYFGEIHLVGKQLNEDRTVDVHGHVNENLGRFIPGMYVEANIYVSMDSVTAIPESAVFERDESHYVFLEKDRNNFRMEEVVVGKRADGWIEILNPAIKPEDNVVVNGVYFLSSML